MDFSLLHGECVSLGIVCASYISMKRNYIDLYEFSLIGDLLVSYDLPIRIQDHIDPLEILSYTKSDKKTDGKVIKFILLQKLGHAYIDTSVCDQEILESIQYIIGEHHEN